MKVIFLDIDGVIQPFTRPNSFGTDINKTIDELSEKLNADYHIYGIHDVMACYLYWDKNAVERIRKIIEETGAKLVISSDWRTTYWTYQRPTKMKDFLRIHNLDQYYYGQTESMYKACGRKNTEEEQKMWDELTEKLRKEYGKECHCRIIEIKQFLATHPEVENYVIIDDMDLDFGSDGHFVRTSNLIDDEQMKMCIKILSNINS